MHAVYSLMRFYMREISMSHPEKSITMQVFAFQDHHLIIIIIYSFSVYSQSVRKRRHLHKTVIQSPLILI